MQSTANEMSQRSRNGAASRGDWMAQLAASAPLMLGALLLAAGLSVAVVVQPWAPMEALTRDPLASLGAPFYLGLMTNLGVLGWSAAAVVCLYSAWLVRRLGGAADAAGFLRDSGLLTALLALDDLFMFHEQLLPEVLGIRERYVFVGYLLLAGVYLARHLRTIMRGRWPLLALALAAGAISVFLDMRAVGEYFATTALGPYMPVAEDSFKWWAIINWACFFIAEAATRVLAVSQRPALLGASVLELLIDRAPPPAADAEAAIFAARRAAPGAAEKQEAQRL